MKKPKLVFDDRIKNLNELIIELESLEEEAKGWIRQGFVKEYHALKIVVEYLKEIELEEMKNE